MARLTFAYGKRSCRSYRNRLRQVREDSFAAAPAGALRDHIARCAACREDWEKERRLWIGLHRSSVPEPEPAFWEGLQKRIMDELPPREEKQALRRLSDLWTWIPLRPAVLTLCLLILILVATPLYRMSSVRELAPEKDLAGSPSIATLAEQALPERDWTVVLQDLTEEQMRRLERQLIVAYADDFAVSMDAAESWNTSWPAADGWEEMPTGDMERLIRDLRSWKAPT